MNRRTLFQAIAAMVLLLLLAANLIQAQQPDTTDSPPQAGASKIGSSFTYQGQLIHNGAPVNDLCNFTFNLWDETGSGSPPTGGNQVGSNVVQNGVAVSDGLFTVSLDFGADSFNGDALWLEIDVNCGEGVITLDPRQPLTPAPYAMYAPPHNTLVAADGDPVDAVYVDNDGKVGIGTTNPNQRLTVNGTVESTSGGFKFPDGTTQTTAAGDVKQLIQDFVVASGESVTAGDVVQFIDGNVLQEDYFGSEHVFNASDTNPLSAAVLSDTKFVVAYQDAGNSEYGTAVVGDVTGDSITYGSEYVFNAADTYGISAAELSPTKFVVVYQDHGNSDYGTAVIGDVAGTTITYGSEYVYNSASTSDISVTSFSSTRFAVAYRDWGNSKHGTAMIGDVAGTTITYGPKHVFNSASTVEISVAALSDTNLVVAYRDVGNSNYCTAVIGDISGTTITYGSEYVFNPASSNYISTAALSPTKFVVAYRDEGGSWNGSAVIGDVSDTTITYGSEYVFNSSSIYDISAVALSPTKFVVVYRDEGNYFFGTTMIGNISGTIITYGSEYVFNADGTWYISAAMLSSNQFVAAYRDNGNSSYGAAMVIHPGHSVGIAKESKTEGQTVPVVISGVSDVHSGLTPGEVYFSDMAGGLTSLNTNRRIGLAISDTELLLGINIYEP